VYAFALPWVYRVLLGSYYVNTLCRLLLHRGTSYNIVLRRPVHYYVVPTTQLAAAFGLFDAVAARSCGSSTQSAVDAALRPFLYRALVLRPRPDERGSPEIDYRVRFSI
jgi:hypothetical protein